MDQDETDGGARPDRAPGEVSVPSDSEEILLPGGRRLEVRPTTAADAELLERLYEALPLNDRYRRFFSSFEPDADFCRRWTTIGERGGFGVIALAHGAPPPTGGDVAAPAPEIVGEAGYALRGDGDGDLAVTVAPEWRGWLGAYLVDVLVRHAAATGIKGLQADVLLENRPMLAVLRHRGAVALEHPDGTVRLVIGTDRDVPSWAPSEHRPRVLVEVAGGRWSGEPAAEAADMATALCSGPGRRGHHRCPVLDGGHCPLADRADAIVVLLDPADADARRLVEAHRRQSPGTPLLVREGLPGTDDESCVTVGPTGEATVARILSLVGQRSEGAGDQPG